MTRCVGKGYEGCRTCFNPEENPTECDVCEDESHWDGDEGPIDTSIEDDVEIITLDDLRTLIGAAA
jgi:hypothetical protein